MGELEAKVRLARALRGHSQRTVDADLWVLRTLGKPPETVTVQDLTALILRNGAQKSRVTYWSWCRSVFQLLRDEGLIPSDHMPDRQLPKIKRPKSIPRPFTVEQINHLRATARQPYRDVIIVASLTGLRGFELHKLEGGDLVEGVNGPELHVVGKGGKAAVIPAHPRVVEVIGSYSTLGRLWRFPSAQALSSQVSTEIRRVLGFGNLHMCRHTFATQLLAATSDIATVQICMRHASVQTTMMYAEVVSTRSRAAVELLAG